MGETTKTMKTWYMGPDGNDVREIEYVPSTDPTPIPAPTTSERIVALEEQAAQTDELAIELYEANLEQQEVNAVQDDALIEIYELIGG